MEGCSIFSGVVYYIIILTPHCFTKYADLLWVVVSTCAHCEFLAIAATPMDFDLPQQTRCHKKRKSADEVMRDLDLQLESSSKKKTPSRLPKQSYGRQYTYCAVIPTHALQSNSEDHETYQHEDGAVQDNEGLSQLYDDISQELRSGQSSARVSDWHQRMERREDSWKIIRQQIFEHVLANEAISVINECALCGREAFIRCHHCTPSVLICTLCDENIHNNLPLHDREAWTGRCFIPMSPTTAIDPQSLQLKPIRRFWPLKLPWRCPNCKAEQSLYHKATGVEKRVLVTSEGRFDLDDCKAECLNCKFAYGDSLCDVIGSGFWPSSACSFNYLFSCQLLKLFDYVQKFVPGTSVNGFLSALEEVSAHNGRISTINQSAFIKAFEEYRYCMMELLQLGRHPILDCPACYGNQHSIHVDGNRKLYRFTKVPRGVRSSYYEGTFIVKNTEVDSHLKDVGYHSDNVTGICGTSRFKAAKASSKTMKTLDETGLVVAGCRHVIAQKAVNMFRGELFGYTHYLHMNEFVSRGVNYFFHDVICQYWPWASRQNFPSPAGALEIVPCLPAMHAKAHSWHCSVLWGGRWQDESGAGSGEDMELLFSYLSRWGLTKYMLAYRREEFLTEAAVFWNVRKIRTIPKMLKQKLVKTTEKLLKLESKLNEIRLRTGCTLTTDELDSLKQQIQRIARNELHSEEQHLTDDKEKYFLLWNNSGVAAQLREYNASNTSIDSIVTGCDNLYKEVNELVSRSAESLAKMQALEEKLCITNEEQRQQCLRDGKILAVKGKLEKLQSQMEMIFLSIRKKAKIIQNEASSSKQRSSFRRSISAEKAKLGICVTNYNRLVEMVEGFEKTSVGDVIDGDFP
ncbi:uncharacterized protein [Dysidea avara]|uniref:uncharacterized protein isoform X3 n=1 Tax=Dysidea avara TaxID=196820 RepID=UPI00332604A5